MARKASTKGKKIRGKVAAGGKSTGSNTSFFKSFNMDQVSKWVERVTLVLMLTTVALLLFVGPFYRGLFFTRELLFAQAVIFGLLIFWGCFRHFRKDDRLIGNPLDLCLAVLLLAYAVSFFVAVNKREALEELLKIAAYIVIYLVVADICRHWFAKVRNINQDQEDTGGRPEAPPGVNLMLHLTMAAAMVVTIASLGVASGNWDFIGAYAGNRIASPMGYANTAAAYLMAAYFLTLGLAPLAAKWLKVLYIAPATLMLMTTILTFSRGAWLLLLPLALLLVLAAAPGEKLRSFFYLLVTFVVAIPAALMVDPIFRSTEPGRAWLVIITAVIVAMIMGALVELYLGQSRKLRFVMAGAGVVVAVTVIIIIVVIPVLAPLHLERSAEEPAQVQSIEQVIENIEAGETYKLLLEVNAEQDLLPGAEQPEYVWGISVLGGVPGYRNVTLIDHQGGVTDGWEEKTFIFQTSEEMTRLEVHFYNQYPGTSAAARSVILSTGEQEQTLRFTLNRILPQRFYDRIFSFNLNQNVDRRFDYFRDALKIIRDYPILGTGGGGWAALYQGYQEQAYFSKEVHNHYLQVWIEAGIFGFLAFLGIWISFAVIFIRNCIKAKASPRVWQLWTASFMPVAALGAHSVIDWNFSMAAVGIFLFALLGTGRSMDNIHWFQRLQKKNSDSGSSGLLVGITGVVVGLFLLVYTLILNSGYYCTWRSQVFIEQGNLKQAVIEMEKAVRRDPLRAENYHNLNVIYNEQARISQMPGDMQTIISLAQRAYELEPLNPRYIYRYGELFLTYVDVEMGLGYIDQMINLRPFAVTTYLQSGWARLRLAEYYMSEGNPREAESYLTEILDIEIVMQERYGDNYPLAYVLGRTHYLLQDFKKAEQYFEIVQDGDTYYEEAQQNLLQIRGEDGTMN